MNTYIIDNSGSSVIVTAGRGAPDQSFTSVSTGSLPITLVGSGRISVDGSLTDNGDGTATITA